MFPCRLFDWCLSRAATGHGNVMRRSEPVEVRCLNSNGFLLIFQDIEEKPEVFSGV
jgi:hypothetical protein